MSKQIDRIVGAVACLLALAVALTARGFRVGFYTDPLGPAGLPYIVAALLGVGGLVLVFRPSEEAERPRTMSLVNGATIIIGLLAYPTILPYAGFVLSTTGVIVLLGTAFRAPPLRSVVYAAAYTGLLYLLFSIALGLPLPIGSFFLRSG